MLPFISAVAVMPIVSFLCSVFESVLLSLTRAQIAVIRQRTEPRPSFGRECALFA